MLGLLHRMQTRAFSAASCRFPLLLLLLHACCFHQREGRGDNVRASGRVDAQTQPQDTLCPPLTHQPHSSRRLPRSDVA